MEKLVFRPSKKNEPVKLTMGEKYGDKSFGCTERYLTKNGKPFLPVMGEFHFTRYDSNDWETELLKIKMAGIDIVSIYLFWIFHEEEEGQFCFDGRRDISRFLRLCKKVGLYAFVRIGPWCHGECRNGGFPDWLQCSGIPLRCNDERYLFYVRRLFSAYSREISSNLFANGGNVIGIQLENELWDNREHLAELKQIALETGLHTPYYTVTGWGPRVTEFPEGELLPVFGCYPAAPWEGHTKKLGINKNYFFSTVRNDSSIGSDRISGKSSADEQVLEKIPHITCELGPGNQLTYYRRPSISSMDVLALAVVSIGSGNRMPGYYMFHGGFNPTEGLYQESILSGYPNDLPVSSYDFQAPLSEYGQPRESYFYLKRLHQFIHTCEASLATMTCTAPDCMPFSLDDRKTPRMYLRSDGDSGYLFFNTHQRGYPLPPVEGLEITVEYSSGDKKSYGPFDIESGCCGVLSLRQKVWDSDIEFMTALPLWKGIYGEKQSLICAVQKGISPVIEIKGISGVKAEENTDISYENGNTVVRLINEDKTTSFNIGELFVTVLNEADSLNFYSIEEEYDTKLFINNGIVFCNNGKYFSFSEKTLNCFRDTVKIEKSDNIRIGSENIYSAFLFSDAEKCPEYILTIDESLADKCYDAIFSFSVRADVIQLYADDILIADDFLREDMWCVSLRRILPYVKAGKKLRMKCSPIKDERNIYLDNFVASGFSEPEIAEIRLLRIIEADSAIVKEGCL